jgi:hypothetical protein
VAHAQLFLFSIDVINDANWLRNSVFTFRHEFDDSSICLWISHDSMVLKERILVHKTELISSSDKVSNTKLCVWMENPKLVLIEAWELDSSWDKHAVSSGGDLLKRSLDTIKNCFQDT